MDRAADQPAEASKGAFVPPLPVKTKERPESTGRFQSAQSAQSAYAFVTAPAASVLP
jgi:hypothetical protein